jgi:hypothetical protein
VCVLLQEPSATVSKFQIPAKLTDALAMGRTVILQDLAPLADVIQSGAVIPVKDKNALPRALEQALAQPPSAQPNAKARDLFLKEFSFAANTPRLRQTLQTARTTPKPLDPLNRFNTRNVPVQVLAPSVDERLFYPRPLNLALRRAHDIPDDHMVLAYTGNVHAGNKDEVHELYKAVDILNQQGCATAILRTGLDKKGLGIENWNRQFEKHLGWVKREQIPDILAAADILVQPGEPGPFNDLRIPCKLPEFFAMGRPVVLPKTNLGLKVAHGKEAYVLERSDAKGIAAAAKEIFSDKTLAGNLAMGGVGFFRTTFDAHHTIRDIQTIYLKESNKSLPG